MVFNTGHCAQTLTTWVSLEALATASPLSVKYLNSQDRRWVRPGGYGGRVIEQQQHTTDSNASSLLVNVGLKGIGFRLHCSNSLQDFFLEKKSSSVKCVCVRPSWCSDPERLPGWQHQSHSHPLFLGWGAESRRKPAATHSGQRGNESAEVF